MYIDSTAVACARPYCQQFLYYNVLKRCGIKVSDVTGFLA